MHFQRAEPPLKMTDSRAAKTFFSGCFNDCDSTHENLFVAHLDDQARCLHLSRYQGDACSAAFPIREIITTAAALGSASLLIAHNHPSGDARPSPADCRSTRRLAAAADAIDCPLLDHLVFGGGDCTSLRQLGLL
jgi:DNA repair protein RadC